MFTPPRHAAGIASRAAAAGPSMTSPAPCGANRREAATLSSSNVNSPSASRANSHFQLSRRQIEVDFPSTEPAPAKNGARPPVGQAVADPGPVPPSRGGDRGRQPRQTPARSRAAGYRDHARLSHISAARLQGGVSRRLICLGAFSQALRSTHLSRRLGGARSGGTYATASRGSGSALRDTEQ